MGREMWHSYPDQGEKGVAWDVEGLPTISAKSLEIIAAGFNGEENEASLAAIRVRNGVAGHVDGLSAISANSWRNHEKCVDNPIGRIWTLVAAKDSPFSAPRQPPPARRVLS